MKWKFSEFSEFRESEKLLKHELEGQLKDPLCYLCLPGPVVSSWFLTQEVAGWNTLVAKIFDRFCRFYRIQLGKTRLMNQTISYI